VARALTGGAYGPRLWEEDGTFALWRFALPLVAAAAVRVVLRDTRDRPIDRHFHALDSTVTALDAATGEAYDAAGDDLVLATASAKAPGRDDAAVKAAVRALLASDFPTLAVDDAPGRLVVGWASLRDWAGL
jgi:hypothetical protein